LITSQKNFLFLICKFSREFLSAGAKFRLRLGAAVPFRALLRADGLKAGFAANVYRVVPQ
jgi:hypothetical protein